MILIKNCPHNNGIITLKDSKSGNIIKSSYSIDGMKRLLNEFKGYEWYYNKINFNCLKDLQFKINDDESYTRLKIKYINGKTGECYKSISYNKSSLLKAIDAYIKVWPLEKKVTDTWRLFSWEYNF